MARILRCTGKASGYRENLHRDATIRHEEPREAKDLIVRTRVSERVFRLLLKELKGLGKGKARKTKPNESQDRPGKKVKLERRVPRAESSYQLKSKSNPRWRGEGTQLGGHYKFERRRLLLRVKQGSGSWSGSLRSHEPPRMEWEKETLWKWGGAQGVGGMHEAQESSESRNCFGEK